MTTAKSATPAKTASGWTDAQVAALTSGYTGDNSNLGALVAGKSAVACRSKLVNLGLYKKNEEATTATSAKKSKVQIVSAIETLLSLPVDSLSTLEKCNKDELTKLANQLVKLSDHHNAKAGIVEPQAEISEAINTNGM